MSYKIAQNDDYLGNYRWNWSAWLEGTPEELDQIRMVTWILHPTFTPSRVHVRTRENAFRLDTGGWGTFLLHAELRLKHKKGPIKLSHMLELRPPITEQPAQRDVPSKGATERQPSIFLSFSSEDEPRASLLQKIVEQSGMLVSHANLVPAGMPLEAAVRKLIREADALITVASSDYLSPWVAKESHIAKVEGTPVFSVSLDQDVPAADAVTPPQAEVKDNAPAWINKLTDVLEGFSTHYKS